MSVLRVTKRNKLRTALIPESIEVMLRETARRSFPENVDSPMIPPRDSEGRQCGRVEELQNKVSGSDPQIYPGTILATNRELPFKKLSR